MKLEVGKMYRIMTKDMTPLWLWDPLSPHQPGEAVGQGNWIPLTASADTVMIYLGETKLGPAGPGTSAMGCILVGDRTYYLGDTAMWTPERFFKKVVQTP